jgi:CBS domain-containing protein
MLMLTLRDILKSKGNQVWTITPNSSVLEALQLMSEKKIGAVLVQENDEIKGIFSERDFVHGVAEKERCIVNTTVLEYMTTAVITVTPEQTIEDCMEIMTRERFRHLPIVDKGKLVGIISIGDIVKEIISSEKSRVEMLENYIQGRGYGR